MGFQLNELKKFKQPFQVYTFYGLLDDYEPVTEYLGGYRLDKSRRRCKVLVTQDDLDHIIADVLEMYKGQIDSDVRSLHIMDRNGKDIVEVKHPQDFITDEGEVRYEVSKIIN